MDDALPPDQQAALDALLDFVHRHPRLLVLTGAGISTDSGIPGYRDADGNWQGRKPIQWREFLDSHAVRQRYWARSMVGWPVVAAARPNAAHRALAQMQQQDRIALLVTQNVDGLHHAAGSHDVIELHGNIGSALCLDCGLRHPRAEIQRWLEDRNPSMKGCDATPAPDGDARLPRDDFSDFQVPQCERCGGILKPDVVFFGDSVPRDRVEAVHQGLQRADAMLVAGSSLMVYSGYRFCLAAQRIGKPVAAVVRGHTRADAMLSLKIDQRCATMLEHLARTSFPIAL
ncbi:NAD-dependent SIR2 family protein deacetylase [Cupriavidus gilardii J11]|uniref:NAD-dependent protein deacetylase n=1 Tax=Cupriavidus gilardii J11 TaxID=936133 RepID=A0A562BJJ2_9BURK|nr:NAD-dependent protein deacetylase [Cupriavidus gilardii]TWG85428.1 NAD-dependent SIR2 family protein deacetylase [Cupriavidus gilardii J11]